MTCSYQLAVGHTGSKPDWLLESIERRSLNCVHPLRMCNAEIHGIVKVAFEDPWDIFPWDIYTTDVLARAHFRIAGAAPEQAYIMVDKDRTVARKVSAWGWIEAVF